MRRISATCLALSAVAAGSFYAFSTSFAAEQADAQREQIMKLSQVTGRDVFAAQLKAILKKKSEVSSLLKTAVAMADGKDSAFSYNGAMILATAAADVKDTAACEKMYRICIAHARKLYSADKLIDSYGGLMDYFYDNKKYDQCIRVCREVLESKMGEDSAKVLLVIGEDDNQLDVSGYDPLKSFRPQVHELMIRSLAKDGKIDQALKMADSLVRQSEGWKERMLRGWVLQEAGRHAESAKVYVDVIDRIGQDATLSQQGKDVLSDRARYILSNVYLESKKIDKSLEILKDLFDRHPDDAGYNNDLGYIWADNDMNLDEAEKLIRKALEIDRVKRKKQADYVAEEDRDKGAYLDSLGWVLFKKKQYEEAKKYLIEALKDKDAQHIEIYDHLGDTYLALGQREAALEAWRQGLKVAGDERREQLRKDIVQKKIDQHGK
jgi:tetratricopeptide (TPR) repeat protein